MDDLSPDRYWMTSIGLMALLYTRADSAAERASAHDMIYFPSLCVCTMVGFLRERSAHADCTHTQTHASANMPSYVR